MRSSSPNSKPTKTTAAERVDRHGAGNSTQPAIGYDKASKVAKTALADEKTVREVVLEEGYLYEDEADEVLDPEKMTHRGILGDD